MFSVYYSSYLSSLETPDFMHSGCIMFQIIPSTLYIFPLRRPVSIGAALGAVSHTDGDPFALFFVTVTTTAAVMPVDNSVCLEPGRMMSGNIFRICPQLSKL